MLGITVLNIEISVKTNGGVFSHSMKLEKGLNVIRAENSSGKSTLVNAIAYSLGLEAILGPGRKRPFAKSLYDEIYNNKVDKTPYFVQRSYVSAKIINSKDVEVVLTRDVQGEDKKISVTTENITEDYFLGSSGHVGSAKSEKGFHNWFAKFIGWKLPNVVKFDGSETQLYLECIFPLFFIEQKRGWSEIQANTPTQYGIQNVKKSAAEFCLGIDNFERDKKIAILKSKLKDAESKWESIKVVAQNLADYHAVNISNLHDFGDSELSPKIEFYYLENNNFISLYNKKKGLSRYISKLESTEGKSKAASETDQLITQNSIVNNLRRDVVEITSTFELAVLSNKDLSSKLIKLEHDYDQYQQLKRLRQVGGNFTENIDMSKCPVCESDLFDSLGANTVKRKPMSLDENIEFLKNQVDFFSNIKNKSLIELEILSSKIRIYKLKLQEEEDKLNLLKKDLSGVNSTTKRLIRERLELEIELRNLIKIQEIEEELNSKTSSIFNSWKTAKGALSQIAKNNDESLRMNKIRILQSFLKEYLQSFQFNPTSINSILVSKQSLRPEQDGYDIVAETSASDYIRIIWSYTLSLLKMGAQQSDVKHAGFIVFDEPRQHEANKASFASLIKTSALSKEFSGQVIIATSIDKIELQKLCEKVDVNISYFDDYIFSLEKRDATL